MAALDADAVRGEHLREPWQAIDRRCSEDGALVEELLEECIEDVWRLLPRTESPCEESCPQIPDQVFAVLLPTDADGLAIEDEDTARCFGITERNPCEVVVEPLQDSNMAPRTRGAHPTVRTAVEDVAIVESRGTLPAPAFHAKRALAGIASPPPTPEQNGVP